MAVPMAFLKIDVQGLKIVGDAEFHGHLGEIVIDALSWSMTANEKGKDKADSKGRGLPMLKHLRLDKTFDRASNTLGTAVLERKPMSVATISVMNMETADASAEKLLVITLRDGFVESIDLNASESNNALKLKESLILSFHKIEFEYHPADMNSPGRPGVLPFEHTAQSVS